MFYTNCLPYFRVILALGLLVFVPLIYADEVADVQQQVQANNKDTTIYPNYSDEESPLSSASANKTLKQKKEYSELAFGGGSNLSDHLQTSNVVLKSQKEYGALVVNDKQVFGSQLFSANCGKLAHLKFLNPDYLITIGDKINIQIWGAFKFSREMIVDTQGNIFLPEVGPVHLQGVANKNLNQVLKRNMERIFLKDVHIYGDLVTAQPVQVYVAGYVNAPGLYNGLSSDSIMFYLCQARGVNPKEGSYRNIQILRQGKVIKRIDLYQFLTKGTTANFQLHQGDTIFVGAMQQFVTVDGNVKSPYRYEINGETISMYELMKLAQPNPSATHVRIERHQGKKPSVHYLPIDQAKSYRIRSGDNIYFTADQNQKSVIVTITGETEDQHQYVLKNGDSLDSLLKRVHFSEEADINNIQLFRESVAEQQKIAVEASLSRLERETFTNNSVTADGAKMQAFKAQLISRFIAQAKNVKFQGQIVLGPQSQWKNIHLASNDIINIPRKSSIVTISGEVMNAISIEIEPNKSYKQYIQDAGGFTTSADKTKILLVHQNGRTEILRETLFGRKPQIQGGDQIIVLSKPPSENWQVTESLTQIMYRIAVAARVAVLI